MAYEVLDSFIIILNLIICVILTRKHCQKSTTVKLMDRSILSLSFADILVGVTGIIYEKMDDIPSLEVLKIDLIGGLHHHMLKLTLVISAFHLVIIATERLLALYKPIIFRFKLKDSHTIFVLIISWVLATLIYGIAAYLGENFDNRADNWVFGALAGVCSIFLVVSYTSMYRTLRMSNRKVTVKPVVVMLSKHGISSVQETGSTVSPSISCSSGKVKGNIITTNNNINSVKNTISEKGNTNIFSEGNAHQVYDETSYLQEGRDKKVTPHINSVKNTISEKENTNIFSEGNAHQVYDEKSYLQEGRDKKVTSHINSVKSNISEKENTNIFSEGNAHQVYDEKSYLQEGRDKKVFYLGMSISFAFIVCFSPYMIYASVYKYHSSRKIAFVNVMALSRANSLINPLIYIWFQYGYKIIKMLKRKLQLYQGREDI